MKNREKIEGLYLEWCNDFLTVARFAEYHGMTESKALRVINTGRALNHRRPTLADHWRRLRADYPAIERRA